MADDTEESSTLAVLSKRVGFCGWQQSMLLYAIDKGDGTTRGKVDGAGVACWRHASARDARVIWSAVVMTSDASEDRRRLRHTSVWERETHETQATPPWRRATRGRVDGTASMCRRHASARDARVISEAVVTTSDSSEDWRRPRRTPRWKRGRRETQATSVVATSDM